MQLAGLIMLSLDLESKLLKSWLSSWFFSRRKTVSPGAGGGGARYILGWVFCGPAPHTLSLFKTEFPFLIPFLRHLTRNHTLCKTMINIETLSCLIHWQSQNYLQLDQQSHAGCLSSERKKNMYLQKVQSLGRYICLNIFTSSFQWLLFYLHFL